MVVSCPAQPAADVEKWAVLEPGDLVLADLQWDATQFPEVRLRLELVAEELCKPDAVRFAERSFAALVPEDAAE
jgi:hypothetical protein